MHFNTKLKGSLRNGKINASDVCTYDGHCLGSISGSSPGGSNGAIQFNDNGKLGGDASLFYINKNNGRIGIGTDNPEYSIHVKDSNQSAVFVEVARNDSENKQIAAFITARARGTPSSRLAVKEEDFLGGSAAMGYDGTEGLKKLRNYEHVYSIAQDEDSSVVWGMAGNAVNENLIDKQLPLQAIAAHLISSIKSRR